MDSEDQESFDAGFDWAMREIRVLRNDPVKLREDLDRHLSKSRFDQGALVAIQLMNPDGYRPVE